MDDKFRFFVINDAGQLQLVELKGYRFAYRSDHFGDTFVCEA